MTIKTKNKNYFSETQEAIRKINKQINEYSYFDYDKLISQFLCAWLLFLGLIGLIVVNVHSIHINHILNSSKNLFIEISNDMSNGTGDSITGTFIIVFMSIGLTCCISSLVIGFPIKIFENLVLKYFPEYEDKTKKRKICERVVLELEKFSEIVKLGVYTEKLTSKELLDSYISITNNGIDLITEYELPNGNLFEKSWHFGIQERYYDEIFADGNLNFSSIEDEINDIFSKIDCEIIF